MTAQRTGVRGLDSQASQKFAEWCGSSLHAWAPHGNTGPSSVILSQPRVSGRRLRKSYAAFLTKIIALGQQAEHSGADLRSTDPSSCSLSFFCQRNVFRRQPTHDARARLHTFQRLHVWRHFDLFLSALAPRRRARSTVDLSKSFVLPSSTATRHLTAFLVRLGSLRLSACPSR